MLDYLEGYRPLDLGFDEQRYPDYRRDPVSGRHVQLEGIEFAAYCDKRVAALSMPVGIGKELVAKSLIRLLGLRTAVVVPFKGLQKQYLSNEVGMLTDIRGRGNYECGHNADWDCKTGLTMHCRYSVPGGGCTYDRKVAEVRESKAVLTNYDFWLAKKQYGGGLCRGEKEALMKGPNPFEMLILDEGDVAEQVLSNFLSTNVYEDEIKRWCDPRTIGEDVNVWREFAKEHLVEVEEEIRTSGMELAHLADKVSKKDIENHHRLEKLQEKLERISEIEDDWVLDERIGTRWGRMWSFDVVWPGRYAERYLFQGISKIVIMSGTLTTKDLGMLGLSKDKYEYKQWSSIFPLHQQPTYLCPARKKAVVKGEEQWVNINIKRGISDVDLDIWVSWMDEFIKARLDRKGLILTTSYEFQKIIMSRSDHSRYMVGNTNDPESESAEVEAEKFFAAEPPSILVSPSFSRGWDFWGKRAEYIIIPKCPFVPIQSKVMQKRLERDEQYADAMCMKKVEQGNGRPKRRESDWAETLLCDGAFSFFLFKNKHLAQEWFVNSVRKVVELPPAPKAMLA